MQSKEDILNAITKQTDEVAAYLNSLSLEKLRHTENDKWSIAENIIHLNKSVAPVNLALSLPKFSFIPFGKPKTHRSLQAIVKLYQSKLAEGATASALYVPGKQSKNVKKEQLIKEFSSQYNTYSKKIKNWSEADLDNYRLPHPVIGKITMREMAFFTIYHLKHHFKTIQSL